MHKTGAILLVAGTCIGSGMIALPLVLAKLGLIPSVALMLFIWFIMYFTSLVNLELNLQAGRGLALGALGRHFSGRPAEITGNICLKLLSYSLLAVFIYGGSSVLQELTGCSFHTIATGYALTSIGVLLLPIRLIDYFNRILFVALLAVVTLLIAGMALMVNWSDLPLFADNYSDLTVWSTLLPVVFTSFGFQVIFHTLTNHCQKDVKLLKQAFLWGSLIPAIIYILWTSSILSAVYHHNPQFYHKISTGTAEVGELIQTLSAIAKWTSIQVLVWWISILAIATSVIGVGIGLTDSLNAMMTRPVPHPAMRRCLAPVIAILPAYLAVVYIPNAFIAALGFAGMILAIIAVLLPLYLLKDRPIRYYPELMKKPLIQISLAVGVGIILCEVINMVRS